MESKIYEGRVYSWLRDYGFIEDIETGERYFVHHNDTLSGSLQPNTKIYFKLGKFRDRPIAIQIEDPKT